MESLTELSKVAISMLMGLVAFTAIALSIRLRSLTAPLAASLARLHQAEPATVELGDRRERIRSRYIALLGQVDSIDTEEFSAGEIETITLRFLPFDL